MFVILLVILMKKIGAVTKNKPIVVMPKARPGDFFNIDTSIPNVIDIVIEKNITPIIDTSIMLSHVSNYVNIKSVFYV